MGLGYPRLVQDRNRNHPKDDSAIHAELSDKYREVHRIGLVRRERIPSMSARTGSTEQETAKCPNDMRGPYPS